MVRVKISIPEQEADLSEYGIKDLTEKHIKFTVLEIEDENGTE